MKKLFAAAIAVSALCCAPALAADLPRKAPAYQAAPVAPAFSWSGFYVGGSLGYAWNDSNWVYHHPTGALADRVTGKTSLNGGFGGGHVGLQQQWGSWVLGAEFNYYGGFSLEGTRTCFNPVANCTTELKSWWTVGPRVGYAVNNVLFYGTGGYAQGKIDTHENIAATGLFVNPASATHGGWFAGAGIEWALMPNVILGVEYTHVDLDTKLQLSSPPLNFEHRNIDLTSDSVRARLTFLFGGGKGPVVAKY